MATMSTMFQQLIDKVASQAQQIGVLRKEKTEAEKRLEIAENLIRQVVALTVTIGPYDKVYYSCEDVDPLRETLRSFLHPTNGLVELYPHQEEVSVNGKRT